MENKVYYTKYHEWVEIFNGDQAIVGITDYAQSQLGDVVYVDFVKNIDDEIMVNDDVITVESVKSVSDVYAPLRGTIINLNEEIVENPELINESPTDEGWMFEMVVSDFRQLEKLMTKEEYNKFVEEEKWS